MHQEDIRPCLHCNYCIDGGRRGAKSKNVAVQEDATYSGECSVNPLMYHNYWKNKIPMPTVAKNVLVVGGGIAGMQAVVTAAQRGHRVTLVEKTNKLGGLLEFSEYIWFKDRIKKYCDYMIRQVKKANVEVLLNTEATPQLVESIAPDALIVAIGGEPIKPNIEGINNDNVFLAMDALKEPDKLGEKVVIIGGGLVGCELAIQFGTIGKKVTVVEMGDLLAATGQLCERIHTLKWMDMNKVQSLLESQCTAITEKGVYVSTNGKESFVEADSVVICTGYKNNSVRNNIFKDLAYDVIFVGDCKKTATIREAVRSGFDAAAILH